MTQCETKLKWKVDVAEFIPKYHQGQLDDMEASTSQAVDEWSVLAREPTTTIQKVNVGIQIQVMSHNKQTQTPMDNDHELNLKIISLTNENEILNETIESLHRENRKIAFAAQQKRTESSSNGNSFSTENLNSKITQLENKIEIREVKYKALESLIVMLSTNYFTLQRHILKRHLKKCQGMIKDLSNVLSLLAVNSIPSIAECEECIAQYREELQKTEDYVHLFEEHCQNVTRDLQVGDFKNVPTFLDFHSQITEQKNFLHDNFSRAVTFLCRENGNYYRRFLEIRQYYSQYSNPVVWHHQAPQFRPIAMAPPPRYFIPQSQLPPMPIGNFPPNKVVTTFETMPPAALAKPSYIDGKEINGMNKPEQCRVVQIDEHSDDNVHPNCNKKSSTISEPKLEAVTPPACSNSPMTHAKPDSFDKKPENTSSFAKDTLSLLTGPILLKSPECPKEKVNKEEKEFSTTGKASLKPAFDSKTSRLNENQTKSDLPISLGATKKQNVQMSEGINIKDNHSFALPKTNPCKESNDIISTVSNYSKSNINDLPQNSICKPLPDYVKNKSANFCDLFVYIKEKIPEKTDFEIFSAIRVVRKSKVKLTGLTKDEIFYEVQAKLKTELPINDRSEAAASLDNDMESVCSICYEKFAEIPIETLSCQHTFHITCLKRWIKCNNICPVCRQCIL